MSLRHLNRILLLKANQFEILLQQQRNKITYRSGAVKPMPQPITFGVLGIFCTVAPGLLLGASISKGIAAFLEENDLFVPSEDDDDD